MKFTITPMTFNINDKVKVQLTELGRKILDDQHRALEARFPAVKQFGRHDPKDDSDGWSEWQLWELMNKFGGHFGNGRPLPFHTIIRIDEKDLGGEVREVE